MVTELEIPESTGRKKFSEAERAKAVDLVVNGGLTLKQAAEKMGCSVPSLQNWKSAAIKDGLVVPVKKASKKTGKKSNKKSAKKTPKKATGETWEDTTPEKPTKGPKKAVAKTSKLTFAELTDQFWAQYKNETVTPKEVQAIYSVLQFAFEKLN